MINKHDPQGRSASVTGQLHQELDDSRTWSQAQGFLAEAAGCTPEQAGRALQHFGEQLLLPSHAAMASFFLACATEPDDDADTQSLISRIVAYAGLDPDPRQQGQAQPPRAAHVEPSPYLPPRATHVGPGLGVAFHGDLDIAGAPLLAAALNELLRTAGPDSPVVLDLHEMTFCDVVGIRALSDAHSRLTEGSGRSLDIHRPRRLSPHRMLHLAVGWGWLPPAFIRYAPRLEPVPAAVVGQAATDQPRSIDV
jgi:STAS domain